jgi:hypothetical protein
VKFYCSLLLQASFSAFSEKNKFLVKSFVVAKNMKAVQVVYTAITMKLSSGHSNDRLTLSQL